MSVVPRHIFLCTKKFKSTHPWFNLFRTKYISLQAGSIVRMFGEKYFGSSASKQRGKVSKHMLWIFELCPFQGVKILSNRSKANEIKLTGSCICRCHSKVHQGSNPVRNKHQRHQFAWSGPLSFRQEAKVWFALYKLRNPHSITYPLETGGFKKNKYRKLFFSRAVSHLSFKISVAFKIWEDHWY